MEGISFSRDWKGYSLLNLRVQEMLQVEIRGSERIIIIIIIASLNENI